MPELSILLPARNAASTIAQAVASTLRAMPRDAELVIVDDGSQDATAHEATAAAERAGQAGKMRIIRHEGSGGVAQALNLLLDATDSALVARMDADDQCLPWRFTRSLAALHAGDDMVFTQIIETRGRRLSPQPPFGIAPEVFGLHLLLTNPVSHPTMLAKRELLNALEGYRHVPAEDYDLWMRAALAGAKIRRLPLWGLLYRMHDTQITASSQWRRDSWESPEQAAVFAQLSEGLVGRPLERLVRIASMPPTQKAAALAEFHRALVPAIDRHDGVAAWLLRRKLNERLAWARSYVPTEDPGQTPQGTASNEGGVPPAPPRPHNGASPEGDAESSVNSDARATQEGSAQ